MGLSFQHFIPPHILAGNNEDVPLEGSKTKSVRNKCPSAVEDCGSPFTGDIYSDTHSAELKLRRKSNCQRSNVNVANRGP